MRWCHWTFLPLITLLAPPALAAEPPSPAALSHFENKIRPVLVEHCYSCHSEAAQKASKLKAALFVDSREGLLKGGDNGPSLVPGKPAESLLIKALHYKEEDLSMPPKGKLPDAVIADFEKWIADGAVDPRLANAPVAQKTIDIEAGRQFWSFKPLAVVPPPAVKNAAWAKTPIDAFVLAKLEAAGIAPNGVTSKQKLIRRATFDLTGLPPTPEEIDAFLADDSPNAYSKLIDRLLASPRYGERWARHWLDVARFGESDGFEHDNFRPAAYHYRDFVIRALNDDLPFNQFASWQIAGDEIAPSNPMALAATGFLTAGVFPTQITEKEFESTRYNQLDDMVGTLGSAFLGLTIGCARCHDHKFDPIATSDYYRLTAAFATTIRSDIDVDLSPPEQKQKATAAFAARRAAVSDKLDAFRKQKLPDLVAAALADAKSGKVETAARWSVLEFTKAQPTGSAKLVRQADGSYLRTGKAADKDNYTLEAALPAGQFNAVRIEVLTDPSLPRGGPGAAQNGNFVLSEIEVSASSATGNAKPVPVKLIAARATHQQNKGNLSVASSIDGNTGTGWAVDFGGIGKPQAAIFDFEQPVGFDSGTKLSIVLRQQNGGKHLIGRVRVSITRTVSPKDFLGAGPSPLVADAFKAAAAGEKLTAAQSTALADHVASGNADYQKLASELAKLDAEGPAIKPVKMQVSSEGLPPVFNHAAGRGYPHFYKDVYQLRRGDPNNKVEPASLGYPRVLVRNKQTESHWPATPPAGARTSYRRTAVANWLTDPNDGAGHLLARVIVNRLWQHHFGRGLVATANDFGTQGDRPTHPELLDWLADDLIRSGWQLKRVHKLMMLSSTYMQTSDTSPDRVAADRENRLLWRFSPRRLEAEPIRDAMLSASGMLDETMHGPGSLDSSMRRRSVYFTIRRSQLIPMMMVLDWPEPLNSTGVRPVTTVAPQALLFLNSPQARQYADGLAKRAAGKDTADTVNRAYRIALGRAAEADEVERATTFIAAQAKAHTAAGVKNADTVAMTDFCQALLCSNEFVFVD